MSFFKSLPEDAGPREIQAPYQEIWEHWDRFSEALMRGPSPLSEGERELIAAFTSGLNSCSFCFGGHAATAEAFGVPRALFDALMDDIDAAPVEERMKPILRFVKKLTLAPARMTRADADAVFAAGWDETALQDAIAVCARFNFMNRLVEGHGVRETEAVREKRRRRGPVKYGVMAAKG